VTRFSEFKFLLLRFSPRALLSDSNTISTGELTGTT